MPLHPPKMIRKVGEFSGRPVQMAEDSELKLMARICQALFLRTSVWSEIP